MVLGIDVSHWQQKVDWKLLKSKGVEFVFIKATQGNYLTDPMLKRHVDGALEAGMILGLYHWDDPAIPAARQRDYFAEKTQGIPYKMVAIDAEQYWMSWAEWDKKEIKQIFDKNALCAHIQAMHDAFNHGIKAPILSYTRQTFVLSYAPAMVKWLKDTPLWLAYYPFKAGAVNCTWEELKEKYVPKWEAFQWQKNWPEDCRNLKFWQFSGDKFKLPGVDTAVDLNLWGGTLDELKVFCGISQEAPTPSQIPAYPAGYLGRVEKVEDQLKTLITEARAHGWKV